MIYVIFIILLAISFDLGYLLGHRVGRDKYAPPF